MVRKQVRTESKRIIYFLLLGKIITSCWGQNNIINNNNEKTNSPLIVNKFDPDICINSVLKLCDYYSTKEFYPNLSNAEINPTSLEHPAYIFCDDDKITFLACFQYEGGVKGAFEFFKIGYLTKEMVHNKIIKTKFKNFHSESGLILGMTYEEVLEIKGNKLTKNGNKITYLINDTNSSFLKKYNMPLYQMTLEFKNNKLITIEFGFEYP